MGTTKRLQELKAGDTAWYRGKDGTVYEVRVGTVAKASPSAMPAWVQIFWTDIEGSMFVTHPERDLMVQDPNPPAPSLAPPVAAEVEVSKPVKRSRPQASSGAAICEGA